MKTGVQCFFNQLKLLDSGFRRNDDHLAFLTFYESIIFVILLILWLLGFIGGYTGGGLIHIVLVVAIIVLVVRLIQGRKIL